MEKTITERKAHAAAIQKILTRWENGEISTAEKREQIAAENRFWYGGKDKRSAATGELLTAAKGPVSHVPAAPAPAPEPDPDPWGLRDEDDDDKEAWWQK